MPNESRSAEHRALMVEAEHGDDADAVIRPREDRAGLAQHEQIAVRRAGPLQEVQRIPEERVERSGARDAGWQRWHGANCMPLPLQARQRHCQVEALAGRVGR